MPFGIDAFLTKPVRYIVWLRDPVNRLVSSYFHARSVPGTVIFDYAKSVGLLEYARNAWTVMRDNGQTRRMADIDIEQFGADPLRCMMSIPIGAVNEDMLAAAKENVSRAVVGIYEHFDESAMRTFRASNITDVDVPHLNAITRTEMVDDDVRSAIREFHEFDYRLYEHARRIFAAQTARFGRTIVHDVPLRTFMTADAEATLTDEGNLRIVTGCNQFHYAITFPLIDTPPQALALEVDMDVASGGASVGLLDPAANRFLLSKTVSRLGRQRCYVNLEKMPKAFQIVVSNVQPTSPATSELIIHSIRLIA